MCIYIITYIVIVVIMRWLVGRYTIESALTETLLTEDNTKKLSVAPKAKSWTCSKCYNNQ